MFSNSFAPKAFPMSTVALTVSPVIKKVKVCNNCEPVATAEIIALSQNLPTIIKSAAPYSACKKLAMIYGNANVSNVLTGLPCVKSISFFILPSATIILTQIFADM